MSKKIIHFKSQMDKLRMHLPEYLQEHGYDITNGKKIRCLNPNHDDHNPSMSSFLTEEGYPLVKCMSCNTTMDIFNVANVIEDLPVAGPGLINNTARYLADKFGEELEYPNLTEEESYELSLYQIFEAATKFILSRDDFTEIQLEEIKNRRLNPSFMKHYKIGICNSVELIKDHLKSLGFMASLIEDANLDNERIFNPNTLIYVNCDEYGRPVRLQARNLIFTKEKDADGKFLNGPKFIFTKNPPRKSIYKNSETLYLLDKVDKSKVSEIIVVEGNSDAITLHLNGVKNAVALCGLGFNEDHINVCRRNAIYSVILCLDNDDAGQKRAREILDKIVPKVNDVRIRFMFLPSLKDEDGNEIKTDPDLFIRTNGIDAFRRIEPIDSFTWRMSQFEDTEDTESIVKLMIPVIMNEQSHISREKMVQELSVYTGFSDKVIRDELQRLESEKDDKIKNAKRSVISSLIKKLETGDDHSEVLLSDALSSLEGISRSTNSGLFEPSTRINNILSIKEYEEDDTIISGVNFGKYFSRFADAVDGDMSEKVLFVGGSSNVGKTSMMVNLCWRIVEHNPNAMCIFLSIDDSAKEILPRFACFDAAYRNFGANRDVFNVLSINKFAKPTMYSDTLEYEVIEEQRSMFFNKFLKLTREERMVLFDSKDGRSLSFIKTMLSHYAEKFPNRKIFFFLDNLHLVELEGYDGREKYKALSNQFKACAVRFDITCFSTVEYTKVPPEQKPNNNNIAESVSLIYDSNFIMHGWNELYALREKARAYFYGDDGNKRPITSWYVDKNKISSFKGDTYYKLWPEKAFFVEVSDEEYKFIVDSNSMAETDTSDYER